jgi:para-nitrobenzyl esterase
MQKSRLLAVGCLLFFGAPVWAAFDEPVRLDSGQVMGAAAGTPEVRVFKGIPYAAPPLGDLRWKAPQPPAHWEGVRPADQFGAACTQNPPRNSAPGPGPSEDCLYVNVWTAAASASERRPVIVWTYGGGFTGGSGSMLWYDGEGLAKKGAVVVTYNYRLGMFGFFSHPELTRESGHNASGNYGLMDMAAALRWVHNNIQAFGGDPGRVTIAGESAGAIMVAVMVASPEGKGLFQRAISQSGAWMGIGIGKSTPLAQAEEAGVKLSKELGAENLAALRAKPAGEIFKNGRMGGLVIDGWLVPEDPSVTFASGHENHVDVLVGSNRDEGTFFVRAGATTASDYLEQTHKRFGDMAEDYLKLHPAASDAEAANSRLLGLRDELGWHMRTFAKLEAERGKQAYLYFFTHEPPTAPGQASRGATHTAEIRYMFNTLDPALPNTETDRKLADLMSTYWANFAATGDPNRKGLPEWPRYNGKQSNDVMVLGDTSVAGPGIEPSVLAFFDRFYARQQSAAR